MAVASKDITLAILAGGAGTRMGKPKAWLNVRRRPILEYLTDRLAWAGPTLLVTAPAFEHPPGSQRFDREVTDPVAGQGPLRGVLTALEHLQTPMLVVATVDMPCVQADHLRCLAQHLAARPDLLGVFPSHADASGHRTEPFPCALTPSTEPAVREQLASLHHSVVALQRRPGFATVAVPDWQPSVWTNLNHPADLAGFEKA